MSQSVVEGDSAQPLPNEVRWPNFRSTPEGAEVKEKATDL